MVKGKPNKKHGNTKYKPKDDNDASKAKDLTGREKNRQNNNTNGDSTDQKDNDPPAQQDTRDDQKKYARRKIESNWHRYEEPEVDEHLIVEDEYDETKDFDYIRQNSASAISHFKFKEEEEWDKDITKEGENILGLNLAQLAANLVPYGMEEKLSLGAMIPDECKYCIRNVLQSVPQPPKPKSTSAANLNLKENVKWSYGGVEKYMHSLGLPFKTNSMSDIGKQSESCSSVELERSYDDDEALNELLFETLTVDNPVKFENEKDPVLGVVQAEVEDSTKRTEQTKGADNHTFDSSVSGELDLDALLDLDSSGDNQDLHIEGHTDSDLDQWLDEMLT